MYQVFHMKSISTPSFIQLQAEDVSCGVWLDPTDLITTSRGTQQTIVMKGNSVLQKND